MLIFESDFVFLKYEWHINNFFYLFYSETITEHYFIFMIMHGSLVSKIFSKILLQIQIITDMGWRLIYLGIIETWRMKSKYLKMQKEEPHHNFLFCYSLNLVT